MLAITDRVRYWLKKSFHQVLFQGDFIEYGKSLHINVLELNAVLYALRSLPAIVSHCNILVRSNNVTTVYVLLTCGHSSVRVVQSTYELIYSVLSRKGLRLRARVRGGKCIQRTLFSRR